MESKPMIKYAFALITSLALVGCGDLPAADFGDAETLQAVSAQIDDTMGATTLKVCQPKDADCFYGHYSEVATKAFEDRGLSFDKTLLEYLKLYSDANARRQLDRMGWGAAFQVPMQLVATDTKGIEKLNSFGLKESAAYLAAVRSVKAQG